MAIRESAAPTTAAREVENGFVTGGHD